MPGALPDRAQAVIIGGGIHGCSVAYHLVKAGWSDVILLARKQLNSGAFCAKQKAAVGLCLVSPPDGAGGFEAVDHGPCTVMVEGRKLPAELRRKPFGA